VSYVQQGFDPSSTVVETDLLALSRLPDRPFKAELDKVIEGKTAIQDNDLASWGVAGGGEVIHTFTLLHS
jgi:hypothetical protein